MSDAEIDIIAKVLGKIDDELIKTGKYPDVIKLSHDDYGFLKHEVIRQGTQNPVLGKIWEHKELKVNGVLIEEQENERT